MRINSAAFAHVLGIVPQLLMTANPRAVSLFVNYVGKVTYLKVRYKFAGRKVIPKNKINKNVCAMSVGFLLFQKIEFIDTF